MQGSERHGEEGGVFHSDEMRGVVEQMVWADVGVEEEYLGVMMQKDNRFERKESVNYLGFYALEVPGKVMSESVTGL